MAPRFDVAVYPMRLSNAGGQSSATADQCDRCLRCYESYLCCRSLGLSRVTVIAKLCGYYAPERGQIELQDEHDALRAQFEALSDVELIAVLDAG